MYAWGDDLTMRGWIGGMSAMRKTTCRMGGDKRMNKEEGRRKAAKESEDGEWIK